MTDVPSDGRQPGASMRHRKAFLGEQDAVPPRVGAIAGTILVFLFFAATARNTGMFSPDGIVSWTVVSAQLMIIASGAALLMIGGEFDLRSAR